MNSENATLKTMRKPEASSHAARVSGMFGRIAGRYDFLNHFLSLGMDYFWRRRLVRMVRMGPTKRVLDLAAGTMDVSLSLVRRYPEAKVLGMDFSMPMLLRGRDKVRARGEKGVYPVLADGRFLPLPEKSVDCVTIAFGIRNILPRAHAYAEALRVLTPRGRLCILEFGTGRERIWRGVYNFYLRRILPGLGRIISGDGAAYRYLADTIKEFPHAEKLAGELSAAGFDRVMYQPLMSGIVYIHVAEKAP